MRLLQKKYKKFKRWVERKKIQRKLDKPIFGIIIFFALIILVQLTANKAVFSNPLNILGKTTPTPNEIIFQSVSVPAPTFTPTPTPIYIPYPTPTPIPWGQTFKRDEHTSVTYFAPDDHMSTADELLDAMNIYRSAHNLPTLSKNDTLCAIAQKRANRQQEFGLSHDGFSEAVESQTEFRSISEVLFGGIQPTSGVHIVEWGWDKSLTGHHEAISNPKWHDGCSGITGYYAVFIFGAR